MTWLYPIPSITTTSRGYNATPGPDQHLGIDFATHAPDPPLPPTPVHASDGGTATYVAWEGPDVVGVGGFGNVVVLTHANGWRSLYAHLSRVDVTQGQAAAQGQMLGLSGGVENAPGSGGSDGAHLHFQIMDGPGTNSQNTVDPAPLLTQGDDMSYEQTDRDRDNADAQRLSARVDNVLNDPAQGVVTRLGRVEKALTDLAAAVAKIPTTGGHGTAPEYEGTVTLSPKP